jgi:hypothetical protein
MSGHAGKTTAASRPLQLRFRSNKRRFADQMKRAGIVGLRLERLGSTWSPTS